MCLKVAFNTKLLLLRKGSNSQVEWVQWRRAQSRGVRAAMFLIASFNTNFLNLDSSHLFGLACLNAPRDTVWYTRNNAYSMLGVMTSNVPCLLIQLYVLFTLKDMSTNNVLLPLVFSLSTMACLLANRFYKIIQFNVKKSKRKISRDDRGRRDALPIHARAGSAQGPDFESALQESMSGNTGSASMNIDDGVEMTGIAEADILENTEDAPWTENPLMI